MGSAAGPGVAELPQFKGRPGWEFTDISGLDLAAYEAVTGPESAEPAETLFEVVGGELPPGVVVTSISEAPPELLGRVVGGDEVFTLLNDNAEYRAGAFVYVPRGVKHKAKGNLTVLTVCVPRGVLNDVHEVE